MPGPGADVREAERLEQLDGSKNLAESTAF
jgi:hypothetical protein